MNSSNSTSITPLATNHLIEQLLKSSSRESSLAELSRCREVIPDLAILLWKSPGVVTILLNEVINIYPLLSPPSLSSQSSTRVCNSLALMQCIASHPTTQGPFLQGNFITTNINFIAQIPLYLYPCLNANHKGRSFEYLRLTCLGVIGALVKNDGIEVIDFLLSTEIVPLCLRIMDSGNELSRTVYDFLLF